MLSSYVLKMVAKPKQMFLGDARATIAIFGFAGSSMLFSSNAVTAFIISGILQPVNIWLTRSDPFYVDIFSKVWLPLVYSAVKDHLQLRKLEKETVDA